MFTVTAAEQAAGITDGQVPDTTVPLTGRSGVPARWNSPTLCVAFCGRPGPSPT